MRQSASIVLMCSFFACLSLASAEEIGASITIEQESALGALGKWTLLQPNDKTIVISAKEYTASGLASGVYTLFVAPPAGTNVTIEHYVETTLLRAVDSPQFTFELGDGDTARFLLRYRTTKIGLVSVDSIPPGISYTMKGPNDSVTRGVTPASYPGSPAGQFSVYYEPTGCPAPRPQSQILVKDGRIKFMYEPDCKTLRTLENPRKRETVGPVQFVDIQESAWYAPFVYRIARLSILTGYKDEFGNATGRFGPENPVTLAELAKIAHEVAGIDESLAHGTAENPLARTASGALQGPWFQEYIVSAEQLGLRIYLDPMLDLARPASRAEVLVTLLQALDIPLKWAKGNVFTDVTRKTTYASAIETASSDGIVSGRTGLDGKVTGLFGPFDAITRAEMTKVLGTVIDRYRSSLEKEGNEEK